ncbi:MAG: molybdopterin biosynthesis protein [Archaeoglobus sp.]|uniref:molybdopterin biosynthesis protein n=1 Tax=Archaeoglobus sp. TaxID=1872626 RepID=UPI001E027006|nr:molybdopterin biosynthesis protein [Archaeoglobus sp.]MBO8179033.1 molybdopterin biosynthesis protein [Archaeoglobus sp.]
MRKVFRDVVTIDEARNLLFNYFTPKRTVETVPLYLAVNRVLAKDVYALTDVPPFDRATMDGYAVRAEDTFTAEEDNPVILKVTGVIEAGKKPEIEVNRGEAAEIATGAMMPKGANAVVMVEYTRKRGDEIEVFKPVSPGENVMYAGSDIMAGELIAREGSRLTHREIGVMAACGIKEVEVYRKPRVAIISTGNELISPGEKLVEGKIYDVNSYSLTAAVEENGGEAILIGIARDDEAEMRRLIDKALKDADIVITSGSTSAGAGDVMYRILDEFNPGVIVHGIAIKPGKPAIIAVSDSKPIFGLPGYPTSAMTVFEVIVAPIIREMAGISESEVARLKAKLALKVFSAEGRREYLPVNVVEGVEGYSAYPVSGSYSGAVTSFAFTDGFVEIPENVVMLEEGEEIEVKLFSHLRPADLMIIGSHCVGVDILLSILREKRPYMSKVINVGSTGGILAVKRGEADIAGTHLLDESGVYNEPIVRKYGLRNVLLVKGYLREQGLIVANGNPKRIRGFEDLLRGDVTFINRNRGSGTRILTDMYLREVAEKRGVSFQELTASIKGYTVEAKTHTSVAVSVASGKADVGVGIKSVTVNYGLDFIPLRSEEYDFLIRKDRMEKEAVRDFLECLTSEEFASRLQKVEGLKVYERTGEVVEID